MTTSNNNSTNTSLITTTSPINQFDDKQLTITIVENIGDNKITDTNVISTDWKEIKGDFISKHEVREEKDGLVFIGASFLSNEDDGVELVENNDGVAITDNNGEKIVKRVGSNINQYHLLTLDYDDGMTVDEAKERFSGLEYLGYTSHNHKKESIEKFRLVFPLTEPVSPDDIRNRKNDILHWAESADTSTLSIGRFFYLPSCPEDRLEHAEVWCNNGKLLDLLSFEVNTNKTTKVSKPVDTEKFSTAVKEAIKNGLKEIGAVNHDPYFKIAASMFNGGMTLQDFIEVSEYLKPNHNQASWLERWKHSSKLNEVSPGFVINVLKEYGIKINQKTPKTKSSKTKMLELEVKTIEQQIKLFEAGKSDDDAELLPELKTKLEEKQRDLKVSETVSVNTFNDELVDLLERRMIYMVARDGLIHEYMPKTGEWLQYKFQNFVNDEPFLKDEKGGSDILIKYMKSQGRCYLSVGLSVKGFKPYERKLNLFRNDNWLQPVEGDYHEVFDILIMSLGGNKEENMLHIKEVIGWKYLHPDDYKMPVIVLSGEGGAGKDLIIKDVLKTIYGFHQIAVITQDEITDFNGLIAGKMAVLINENTIDKTNMEKMKNLFASKYLNVNEKHQVAFMGENTPLYFIASNEVLGAILLSGNKSDRRFSILQIPKSIPEVISNLKNWTYEKSLKWWFSNLHKLSDPIEVAKWLNHIVEIAKELESMPTELHGDDHKRLIKTQSGPLEWLYEHIFERKEFKFISVKEAYVMYKLKCDEFGMFRPFNRTKFKAMVDDHIYKKIKHINVSPKQKVKTSRIDVTSQSGWVKSELTGTIDISDICYIDEDKQSNIKAKYLIVDDPFGNVVSDK
tara:strand:+ start:1794 stop:4343 length:2550 start_codon:yes stop_codon:yes gene_type:complete